METGILEDGSLSPRLKGDIYWKKQKLMFQSDRKGSGKNSKPNDILITDLFDKYHTKKNAEKTEITLTGDEFLEWPPTAVGRDVSLGGVSDVMVYRDRLKASGEDPDKLSILEKVVSLYFAVNGFDEETRQPVKGEIPESSLEEYRNCVSLYVEKIKGEKAEADPDEAADEAPASDVIMQPVMSTGIGDFKEHIPENYVSQIKDGSLKVTAYYVGEASEDSFLGLSITGVHKGWVEIVWVSLPEGDSLPERAVKLISFMVDSARAENRYKGVFIELHKVEETPEMVRVLEAAGMKAQWELNNNYEFTAADVKVDKKLVGLAAQMPCASFIMLDRAQRAEIESRFYRLEAPAPVSLPIPWNRYRPDLSMAFYDPKAGFGLFLISETGDTLVADLFYGSNPMVTGALLGTMMGTLGESLLETQKVLVPIVVEASRHLVERLVPGAKRGEIMEALVRF